MKRLFRQPDSGPSGYAALAIFVLAWLSTLALVIAPDLVKVALDAAFPFTQP